MDLFTSLDDFEFQIPLLNSASRWSSNLEELEALYLCEATGAVTTRTCLLNGFAHDDAIHQHCFYEPATMQVLPSFGRWSENQANRALRQGPVEAPELLESRPAKSGGVSSLNTLGYSPLSLNDYFCIFFEIERRAMELRKPQKPFIFSVTGTAEEVAKCYEHLVVTRSPKSQILMEVNLSCPNIQDKPPPAYSSEQLQAYLDALQKVQVEEAKNPKHPVRPELPIAVGLKLPPFTSQHQFDALIEALLHTQEKGEPCPVSFLASTNTLGQCLLFYYGSEASPIKSADGSSIGGLAGSALHPLALGNVRRLRTMLDAQPSLSAIRIIGVGGVHDNDGFKRMKAAGAFAVGVATAFGAQGIGVFEKILYDEEAAGKASKKTAVRKRSRET